MRKYLGMLCAGAALAAMSAVAGQAETVHFNVSPGLWEITSAPKVGGQLPISDAEMAKIPPAQRARFEAAMHAAMGAMQKPHTMRECLTQDKINKGFDIDKHPGESCNKTVSVNSSTSLMMKMACTGRDGNMNGTFNFVSTSPTSVTGTADMVMSRGSKTMTVNTAISGHWVGADCGKIKDVEMVN